MKVTKAMIERAQRIEKLQSASYRTGSWVGPVTGEDLGTYTSLADFAYNDAGQTPRRLCSFTADLASLLAVNGGSFVTAVTDEAAWYIDAQCCAEYEGYLRAAAIRNNLTPPEGL